VRYVVRDDDGTMQTWLDDDVSCNAREMGDLCGGCDSCMLKQYEHYGAVVDPIESDAHLAVLKAMAIWTP